MGYSALCWFADDGKEFRSEAEMIRYEMQQVDFKEIDIFIAGYECTDRRKSEYTKVLRAWQEFKNAQLVALDDEIEGGDPDPAPVKEPPVRQPSAALTPEQEAELQRIRELQEIDDSFNDAALI